MYKSRSLIFIGLVVLLLLAVGCTAENQESTIYNIYIPNAGDGTVSVINSVTKEVEQTLKIGETASHGVAVTLDNKYLFTGDLDGGNIYVVETDNNEIVKTIEVGEKTHGIDMSPDGKYVLVAAGRSGGPFLAVIDTAEKEVVAIIEDRLAGPTHMSFSPDGTQAYVADPVQDAVVVVDMVNLKTKAVWSTGAEGAQETRTSPDGKLLYVANYEGNKLSVLDTSDGEILFVLPAGKLTHAVDVSPDGKYVWVVTSESGEIIVLDVEKEYEVVKTLNFSGPNHLAFHPDGEEVYITDTKDKVLITLDAKTFKKLSEIPLGQAPHEIDFVAQR